MNRFSICLCAGILLAAPAFAEDPEPSHDRSPEAVKILEKVDAAIKAVKSVRCHVSVTPSGVATNFAGAAQGESVMVGWTGALPEKFYARVKTTLPDSEDPVELTGGGDGDTYFIVDHTNKKAYEDMDPAVMGQGGRVLQRFGMIEFVHDHPFDDELDADEVKLIGTETVDGEECYEINVVYAGGQGESTWFFAKSDYLPRRRIQRFEIPQQGEGALEISLTDVEVNVEADESLFKLKLPEGYEQIDDFAP